MMVFFFNYTTELIPFLYPNPFHLLEVSVFDPIFQDDSKVCIKARLSVPAYPSLLTNTTGTCT